MQSTPGLELIAGRAELEAGRHGGDGLGRLAGDVQRDALERALRLYRRLRRWRRVEPPAHMPDSVSTSTGSKEPARYIHCGRKQTDRGRNPMLQMPAQSTEGQN